MGVFEAARWAPSANNAQPWRFVYARRGTPAFERFLAALAPGNRVWAARAAALVAIVSVEVVSVSGKAEPVPSASHSFDAGAAWAQLALQAHLWGWSTHAMGGFDREKVRSAIEGTKGLVGTAGVFTLSPTDHMGLGLDAFEMLTVKDGRFVPLAK
jgi:nitroreductase